MTGKQPTFVLALIISLLMLPASATAQYTPKPGDPYQTLGDSEAKQDAEIKFEQEPPAAPARTSYPRAKFAYPSRFYLGISPFWAIQHFDHGDARIYGFEPDFDDTFGGGITFGYSFPEAIDAIIVSLQTEIAYFHQFEWDSAVASSSLDIATLTGSFKVSLAWRASPFIEMGIGLMYSNAEIDESNRSYDDDEIDLCARYGLGMDFFFNQHVALQAAASYFKGLNDVDNLNFYRLGLGISFYF